MRTLWFLAIISPVLSASNLTEVVSSYSKVSDNRIVGNLTSATMPLNDDEYDDFDEATEKPRAVMDGESMLKFVSGLVNLFALMNSEDRSLQPRSDDLAHNINGLAVAQDRYNPTTATKKFKLAQGGYPPVNQAPIYMPPPRPSSDPYSNGGKTSYDADADMMKKPEAGEMKKPPMKDYMAQNDPPVIQQSYSYEVPEDKNKPWESDDKPLGPVYYPWMSKKPGKDEKPWMKKPPMDEEDYGDPPKPDHYYPWMHPPKKEPQDEPPQGKPGKNPHFDEPEYIYPVYPGHDHGVVYEDHHDDDDKEMADEDRESKRPYTYYHLGRKLWYIPLLFSLYFIIYIGALILKSIARHKVQFPEKLWEHDHHGHDRQGRTLIDQVTENFVRGMDKAENKFM